MKNNFSLTPEELNFILSPEGIRDRARRIFDLTREGRTHFIFSDNKLQPTINYVLKVIQKNYPRLDIPFHSRWGHFRVGGIDRVRELDAKMSGLGVADKARSKLDLVITSVLLDAGAGMQWKYNEESTGKTLARSEGLAIASYDLFLSGAMGKEPFRAEGEMLRKISSEMINKAFQVSAKNPLVGVEGRVHLMNSLGFAVENKEIFREPRPGSILDYLVTKFGKEIPATGILRAVIDAFGPIWPGRLSADKINLGDVWIHPALGAQGSFESLVPFHKLSQWLTYSLIEPIEEAGCKVSGVDELTGLAEYRNGGLMIDSGLISLKDAAHRTKIWEPDSELIVEWRALTINLLDKIAEGVRKSLGKTPEDFPLAKVLEGGTWWAGRNLAKDKRDDGGPPLKINSDGTVF